MGLSNYRLKDGSIYWHKLYYDIIPDILTRYSPPGGDYNYAYYLYQPHKYLRCLYLNVKWFIQRGRRGYADCDVWSIDGYILKWLPDAIETLRKTTHGYPPPHSAESWDYVLFKLHDGLRHEARLHNMEWENENERFVCERKGKEGMRLLFEYFHDLWD